MKYAAMLKIEMETNELLSELIYGDCGAVEKLSLCHSRSFYRESSICKINMLWIPAFAGMTTWCVNTYFFNSPIVTSLIRLPIYYLKIGYRQMKVSRSKRSYLKSTQTI